jgi:nucleotide-binding universal stress UspA family protein
MNHPKKELTMKTLLVAFDNSAPSVRAADKAAELSRRLDARVKLVYAVNPPAPLIGDFSGLATRELLEKMKQTAERVLEDEAKRLAASGVPAETEVLEGRPADAIAELAQSPEVALILIGRSGHGALAHAILGSVVNRLPAISTRSVLVVP